MSWQRQNITRHCISLYDGEAPDAAVPRWIVMRTPCAFIVQDICGLVMC
jgi:hypothetical protein